MAPLAPAFTPSGHQAALMAPGLRSHVAPRVSPASPLASSGKPGAVVVTGPRMCHVEPPHPPGGSPAAVCRRQSVWAPWGMRGWLWFVCLFLCLVIKTFIWPSKRNLICSVSKLLILTPRRRATGHGAGTRSPLTDVSREAVVAGGRAARLPRGGREGLPRVTQPCQAGRAPPSPRS